MSKEINGSTKVYGVIGNPIAHTLSPNIHKLLIQRINDNGVYVPFHVTNGNLEKAISGAYALKIRGLNVTIPYKQDVMSYLYKIDEFAMQIGAVNTLKYTESGYIGYNTDVHGLYQSLKLNDVSIKDKNVLILGCGGAARASAIMCGSHNVKHLYIANRTFDKADSLKELVKKYYKIEVTTLKLEDIYNLNNLNLCIQTTPLGMYPKDNVSPIMNTKFYDNLEVAVDLIYNPDETLFLKQAREKGLKTINGLEMLFYQGVKSFEIWNDLEFSEIDKKDLFTKFKNSIDIG